MISNPCNQFLKKKGFLSNFLIQTTFLLCRYLRVPVQTGEVLPDDLNCLHWIVWHSRAEVLLGQRTIAGETVVARIGKTETQEGVSQ